MANQSIPSIKVGKKSHPKTKLDLSFDSNTTSCVGFVQPIGSVKLVPNSNIRCQLRSGVRLAPVAVPTFGRFQYKTYGYYVPLRDIYMPYDDLVSGTPYSAEVGTYIPTSLPKISIDLLTMIVLTRFARVCSYTGTPVHTTDKLQLTGLTLENLTMENFKRAFRRCVPAVIGNFYEDDIIDNSGDITPESADFVMYSEYQNVNRLLCYKLTRDGKNLRQILIGLGYQLNIPSYHWAGSSSMADRTFVSLLPLLAYYKAWFDLFAVKRKINWHSTNAYKLINYIAQHNIVDVDAVYQLTSSDVTSIIYNLFNDLTQCYYTCDPDFFTSHLDEPASNLTSLSVPVNSPNTLTEYTLNVPANTQPDVATSTLNPVAIRVLEKVLRFVNVNSTIGARVKEYMAAHGLGMPDDNKKTHYIGSNIINIDISAEMSTADTANTGGMGLGEYAGKGYEEGASDHFSFDNKESGYFIILGTIVPRAGYVQGIEPSLFALERFEQYHPELDAMCYEVTDGQSLVGSADVLVPGSSHVKASSFGFTPLYTGAYKTHLNILNGDLSLRGTRSVMLPYVLDRYFTPTDGVYDPSAATFESTTPTIPVRYDDSLRTIGKVEGFGNFDRIFSIVQENDERYSKYKVPLEDNFIINNVVELKVLAPVIPISESWDTDWSSHDMQIEKA